MNTIIEFKAVDILQKKNIIFQNINFKVTTGEFIYIIGKTGSGKSSLLKSLYAEVTINQGSLNVLNYSLNKIDDDEISNLRRRLGIVFQDFQLLTDRSLYNNLLFILESTGWKDLDEMNARIKEVLCDVHLENCEHKMPYELSGGEQQRATIARSLLNRPEIILADEPTGNLDPEKSEKIIALLKKINDNGTTIIVATHDYSIIKKFPSHTFICENKSIVEATGLKI